MVDQIKSLISSNQFLLGGLVLGIIAGVIASLKKVPGWLFTQIKELFVITIKIESTDEPFRWIMAWLANHPSKTKFRSITPVVRWVDNPNDSTHCIPKIAFAPAIGSYRLHFNGILLWVKISTKDVMMGDISIGQKKTMEIMKFGKNKESLDLLLQSAFEIYTPKDYKSVPIYYLDAGMWVCRVSCCQPIRTRDTLAYDGDLLDRIDRDITQFINRKEWYIKMGIPYRRGYLFYGPPGNGKSSLALFLASHLHRNICTLSLSAISNDSDLNKYMLHLPANSILLIEDIDAAFTTRIQKDKIGVTFSGLLNAIDGLGAADGRILVMTTNHKDKLDPALIRAGRADVHEYIGNASYQQICTMFSRFFPESTGTQQDQFASAIPDGTMSMAKLQEILLESSCPEMALTILSKSTEEVQHEP